MNETQVKIKKPRAIVMDLTGTLATKGFMTNSQQSRAFLKANLKNYLRDNWGKKELRVDVNFMRLEQMQQQQKEENTPPPAGPPLLSSSTSPVARQVTTLVDNVNWRLQHEHGNQSASWALFHLHFADWAYRKGILKTP